jgi:hypothetical protein
MLAEKLSSLGLLLLFEKEFVDVARDATLGDRNLTNKLVQLLIVLNGKLDVSGNNTNSFSKRRRRPRLLNFSANIILLNQSSLIKLNQILRQ